MEVTEILLTCDNPKCGIDGKHPMRMLKEKKEKPIGNLWEFFIFYIPLPKNWSKENGKIYCPECAKKLRKK